MEDQETSCKEIDLEEVEQDDDEKVSGSNSGKLLLLKDRARNRIFVSLQKFIIQQEK